MAKQKCSPIQWVGGLQRIGIIVAACFLQLIIQQNKEEGRMWRSIGSIQSGQDKSVRSNRSREQVSFEPFHKHKSTNLSRDNDRSFCFDYFQKKREDVRNMTYDSRARSQKSLRINEGGKDDMFTSMRNILNKEQAPQSLLTNKNNLNNEPSTNKKQDNRQKTEIVFKQASTRVRNLKKEQQKLKGTIENEFMTFKNLFLQLEDKIHKTNEEMENQESAKVSAAKELDTDFLKEVVKEAMGIQKYFAEMDRKKEEIMSRLTHA